MIFCDNLILGDFMKHINFADEEIFFDYNNSLCNNGKWFPENHYHNSCEAYFLESGECDYFIDDKIYHMLPGDMVVIGGNIIHNTVYGEKVCSRMLINCSKKHIPIDVSRVLFFRNSAKKDEISHIFSRIREEYKSKNQFSEEIVTCYIRLLMLIAAGSENMYTQPVKHSYIEEVAEYIKNNLDCEVTLSKVAARFSVSAGHLSRQFKKDTGFTFSEYLDLIRFKKAEEMLLYGKKETITQIAHMCGFGDSNYFSVKFKKIYGVSPLKWKNRKSRLIETDKNS